MKILKSNAGALTNFEVLAYFRSKNASTDPAKRIMSKLTPSEFQVFDYLVESAACNQTKESITEFKEKSKDFQLAKAEVVNIANIRPSSMVEVYVLVEQCDSRMNEDRTEELVKMVKEVLPPHPKREDVDEEVDEEENDGEDQMGDS